MAYDPNALVNMGRLATYNTNIQTWALDSFKLVEQESPEAGYLKTYVLQARGVNAANSTKINIPKDFLVKHAEVKTAGADDPSGLASGKKYIDLEINIKGYEGETDAFDTTNKPTAGASTLGKIYRYTGTTDATYTNGNYYVCTKVGDNYSWAATTIAEASHLYIGLDDLMNYTSGNGINITGGAITVVPNTAAGLDIDASGVKAVLSGNLQFTNGAIDIKTQNASSASDANAPTVGGITKADYVAFNGAIDTISSTGTTSDTVPTENSGKNETVGSVTYTYSVDNVGNTTDTPSGSFTVTEHYVTYGEAIAADQANNITAKSGLMTGAEKANLAALYTTLGSATVATDEDIAELFPTT